jgi:hypothetical protein
MDRRNTEGRWDEARSTNEILQQAPERNLSFLPPQLASVAMRRQEATLASLQHVCRHALSYTHPLP